MHSQSFLPIMQYLLINQWRTYPAPHKSFNKNEKVSQRKMNRNKFKPKIPILYFFKLDVCPDRETSQARVFYFLNNVSFVIIYSSSKWMVKFGLEMY